MDPKRLLIAGAAGGALFVGGIAAGATTLAPMIASAATATPSTGASGATGSGAPTGAPGAPGGPGSMPAHGSPEHEGAETPVTGDNATKAQAAAVKAVGGGTAGSVTSDFNKSGYEVTVTKSDGSSVEVHLDSSFNVMHGPRG